MKYLLQITLAIGVVFALSLASVVPAQAEPSYIDKPDPKPTPTKIHKPDPPIKPGGNGGRGGGSNGNNQPTPPTPVVEAAISSEEVEQVPQFPGGDEALQAWLKNNVVYPAAAAEAGVSGEIKVKFIVEKNGSITDVKVVRGKHQSLDAEAKRVVSTMPTWTPGRNNGKTVRVICYLPITIMPKSKARETYTVNGVSFTMIEVRGGTFTMGATAEQGSDAYDDEKPSHQVTLSDYYIGQTEVTQAQWKAVMYGNNPSGYIGDNLPVERVSWNDIQEFIWRLNDLTGAKFRLPTEAEWEFAARGGTKAHGNKYSGSNNIDFVAWYYSNNPGQTTHPVATKAPNELGIYDMSGNVWEWCQDWKGDYSSLSQTDPVGSNSGSDRVVRRGGSAWSNARLCRVSIRGSSTLSSGGSFDIGFRLAL